MASSIVVKPLFGVLGAGIAGGTVVLGYTVFNKDSKKEEAPKTNEKQPASIESVKKSISEFLKQDANKQLLNKDDGVSSSDWQTAGNNYRQQNSSVSGDNLDPLKVSSFLTVKGSETVPQDFLDKCDSESKKQVSGVQDEAYIKVYKGCTKDKVKG